MLSKIEFKIAEDSSVEAHRPPFENHWSIPSANISKVIMSRLISVGRLNQIHSSTRLFHLSHIWQLFFVVVYDSSFVFSYRAAMFDMS